MQRLENFINGQYQSPVSEEWMDNYDPSTGMVYCQLADSNELDMVQAIQAANKAFIKWSKTTAQERSKYLFRIADIIEQRADELAEAESRDVGKPLWLAQKLDIPRAVDNFRFFAGRILHHQEMSTSMDGEAINYTLRQPLGVAGLISPWNLPLYLLTWKIAPALACGNTVVCKPSEITPMTAYLLGEILQQAGLPEGVVNIVLGRGDRVGAFLVSHPSVPLISFTGGTTTGQKVQEASAQYFKKTSLELGGKNATIILKDVDLKKIMPGVIRASFLNQGEICLCSERIFVQQDIYDDFLSMFKDEVEKLKVGDRQHPETYMGPLVSRAHFDKVKSCIEQAVSERGNILTGGTNAVEGLSPELSHGYFLRPTVITDLTDCSELQQTEIFGPVVTVRPFKYPHEAIKWTNTSPYGLAASLWTNDLSKAHKMAAEIDAGTVWVNTWLKRDLRVPFGGMKNSGLGREGGDHSFDFYTELKTVCIQL